MWLNILKKRGSDLLIMNVFECDEWNKLCFFLNKTISIRAFPNKNKGNMRIIIYSLNIV